MSKPAQLIPIDPPPSYDDARKSPIPHNRSPSATPGVKRPPPGPPPPLNLPALNELRKSRVVLASASPRRRALLAQIGLTNIDIVPSSFGETLSHDLGALNYVLETASTKAHDVYATEVNNAERGEPAIVIAADTIIVAHDGRILEKPRSESQHLEMLRMLRDQGEHKVMTAVAVMRPLESAVDPGYRMETHVEETTVRFDPHGTLCYLTFHLFRGVVAWVRFKMFSLLM